MARIGIYCRVSTLEQQDRGSIETQVQALKAWCRVGHHEIAGVYRDEDVSGTIPLNSRPEGARLLRDASNGRMDTVCVYKLDRLSRSVVGAYHAIEQFEQAGVSFVSATEPLDTSNPIGRALLGLLAVFAALERDQIQERTYGGKMRVAREGRWPGGPPPFGYRLADHLLLPAEDPLPCGYSEADVIRLIYCLATHDNYSLQAICDYLTNLTIPPPAYCRPLRRGPPPALHWRSSTVAALIAAPTYRGRHVYGSVERDCPPLVDRETWDLAQANVEQRRKFCGRGSSTHSFLLRNLVRCACCGRSYIGATYRHGRRLRDGEWFYACGGKRRHLQLEGPDRPRCKSPDVHGPTLEKAVWAEILRLAGRQEETLAEIHRNAATVTQAASARLLEVDRLKHSEARLDNQQDKLNEAFLTGLMDEDEVRRQKERIAREKVALAEQIAQAEAEFQRACNVERQVERATHALETLAEVIRGDPSPEQQRRVIEDAVEVVTVDRREDGRPRVHVKLVLRDTAETAIRWCSRPCGISLWSVEREIAA